MWPRDRAVRSSGPFDARSHAGFAKCSVSPFDWPIFGRNGLLLLWCRHASQLHSATGRALGGVSGAQAPLSGGQSCTPGWRSQQRVRLASGLWADELVRRLPVGQRKPGVAVGRRACPSRQLRRRSTSWSPRVRDCMRSTQAPSRLKQIDGRSCTGNANLLKLGGRLARPLRGFATG
jgi:hypothetical protein